MNLPLPGAADIPAADDAESKVTPAPTAPQAAADEQPPEALWDDSEDEGEDDADRDEGAETAAREPAEPTVPIRFEDVISGQFDAEVDNPEVALPKRVLSPQADTPKLHKVLAQAGLGSRLEMEQLIMEGRISVNNEPAHIGQRIQFGDQIKINGKPIRVRIAPPAARVIAYHKPVGEVVTHDDPQNRLTGFRKRSKLSQSKLQSANIKENYPAPPLHFSTPLVLATNTMH